MKPVGEQKVVTKVKQAMKTECRTIKGNGWEQNKQRKKKKTQEWDPWVAHFFLIKCMMRLILFSTAFGEEISLQMLCKVKFYWIYNSQSKSIILLSLLLLDCSV